MSEALSSRGYISDQAGGGPSSPTLVISVDTIDIVWASPVSLTVVGQTVSNWSVTTVVGAAVSVLSVVQLNSTTTRITTTDQTLGGSYIINVPAAAVTDSGTGDPNAFFSLSFTGDGHLPSFISAVPQSTITILVTFSEPVQSAEALNPAHYIIGDGLFVVSVSQQSSTQYLVNTNETSPGTIYTVTVSGIHDLAGNPVT